MKNLLSSGMTNTKTAKNLRKSYILYLLPSTQNSKGINLCPMASQGCLMGCLVTAGRGIFESVKQGRARKTELYINNRLEFLAQLSKEISTASKNQNEIAVRLNGTSDIPFHKGLNYSKIGNNVVFYDYTKIPTKAGYYTLPNGSRYVVTLSRSESNEADCIQALRDGKNVAVVFSGNLPEYWHGYPVIDGDERDDLMLDYTNVVIGLKAKGKAKKDTSGFVVKS